MSWFIEVVANTKLEAKKRISQEKNLPPEISGHLFNLIDGLTDDVVADPPPPDATSIYVKSGGHIGRPGSKSAYCNSNSEARRIPRG